MLISGINHGANLGDDVLYSGTVAAAMEGRFLGIPAIAVSLVLAPTGAISATAAALVRRIVERNLRRSAAHRHDLERQRARFATRRGRGIRTTRLGFRHKSEPVVKGSIRRASPIYWIGPRAQGRTSGPGTDFHAIAESCVSVTPLKVDLTAHAALGSLEIWLGRFR